ncbi:hypothetical protein BVY03_00650 [bacterium K02(2017)]|nr:hypothetical protein BVY03_00650 [bacterium K02(2017)]
MLEQLAKLIIDAMKQKQKERLEALRYLKSMLMENKTAKSPRPELDVVITHHKKLKESVSLYPEDSEQRNNLTYEISVIEEFMPKSLEEADVVAIIQGIKSKLDKPNMGAIMKELSPQIKGRFDGKRASDLAKEACE